MDTAVNLAPGTERNALAARFADVIRTNIQNSSGKREQFRSLRGCVFVVVNDPPVPPGVSRASVVPSWGGAMTLRFDYGQLTIHDGQVGVPDLTLRGDPEVIDGLPELLPQAEAPALLSRAGAGAQALWWTLGRSETGRRLTVYGLARHPRLTLGVLRVLSRHRW